MGFSLTDNENSEVRETRTSDAHPRLAMIHNLISTPRSTAQGRQVLVLG